MPRSALARASLSRRQALVGAAVGAGWLTGCQAPRPPLRVGSIVFPGYELTFLARELGLLRSGELHLVEMSSNTDTLRALALGRLEAANLTLDEVLVGRNEGLDLRVVLVLDVSAGADVVMATPAVATLADLKGRRIGAEEGATGAVMLGALLDAAGLSVDQVHKVPTTLVYSVEAFKNQRLDAIVTAEPWASELEAQGAHRLFDSSAAPGLIVDVLAVRGDALARSPDTVRQLVAGHLTALARFRAEPAQVAPAMAARLRLTPDGVPGAFRGLDLPDAAANRRWLTAGGDLQRAATHLGRLMLERQLIGQAPDLAALADPRFLPPP